MREELFGRYNRQFALPSTQARQPGSATADPSPIERSHDRMVRTMKLLAPPKSSRLLHVPAMLCYEWQPRKIYSSTSRPAYNAPPHVKAVRIGGVQCQISWVGFSHSRDAHSASIGRRATGLFTQQQGPGGDRPASMLGRLSANSRIVSSLISQQIQHTAPMRSADLMVQHHIESNTVTNS